MKTPDPRSSAFIGVHRRFQAPPLAFPWRSWRPWRFNSASFAAILGLRKPAAPMMIRSPVQRDVTQRAQPGTESLSATLSDVATRPAPRQLVRERRKRRSFASALEAATLHARASVRFAPHLHAQRLPPRSPRRRYRRRGRGTAGDGLRQHLRHAGAVRSLHGDRDDRRRRLARFVEATHQRPDERNLDRHA